MYAYYVEPQDRLATEAEADLEYAIWAGEQDRDRPWVLSDRDVWYRNPYYTGPKVPHPEDDIYTKEDMFWANVSNLRFDCVVKKEVVETGYWAAADDYVPF